VKKPVGARRVVVTGLGAVSPVGNTVPANWEAILAGRSGIGEITRFDVGDLPTRIAGEVRGFDVSEYLAPKDARKFDSFVHYGLAAAFEAQKDAGLEIRPDNAERVGVAIGAGMGGITGIESTTLNSSPEPEGGGKKVSPFYIPSVIINMISGQYSIMSGAKGPNFACVTACTTGVHNIGYAARSVAWGDADVMIAGGAEAALTYISLGGFCSARALSRRNDDPAAASRPWDLDRDGFVFSEGAGVLVLEELEHARARGAHIYAELAGYGMSGDAHHITLPAEGGDGARRCMLNALHDAELNPEDVDYVNAHGTSTPAGDRAETHAIRGAFGAHADNLAVSSTKSMTGHMLGAAGSIEAVYSVLALRDNIAPPTINLETPDPECDLDYVPNKAREMKIDVALSNSFGFGGTNGSLVFSRLRD